MRYNIIAWYIANCGVLQDAGNYSMGNGSAGVRDESMHYFNINVATPLKSPSNAVLLFVTSNFDTKQTSISNICILRHM